MDQHSLDVDRSLKGRYETRHSCNHGIHAGGKLVKIDDDASRVALALSPLQRTKDGRLASGGLMSRHQLAA